MGNSLPCFLPRSRGTGLTTRSCNLDLSLVSTSSFTLSSSLTSSETLPSLSRDSPSATMTASERGCLSFMPLLLLAALPRLLASMARSISAMSSSSIRPRSTEGQSLR